MHFIVQGGDEHLGGKQGLQENSLRLTWWQKGFSVGEPCPPTDESTHGESSGPATAARSSQAHGRQGDAVTALFRGAAWLTLAAAGSENGRQSPRGEAKWLRRESCTRLFTN